MATIYYSPQEIPLPIMDWMDMDKYRKDSDIYLSELNAFCLKRKKGKNIGEIIKFQIADGYAEYMIASMKPLELIHIPLLDAYQLPYIQNLTTKDVQEKIDQQKKLEVLFKK
jgi:hypothetical protein